MASAKTTARRARRDYLRKIAKVRAIRARIILTRKKGGNLIRLHRQYAKAKADRSKAKRVYLRWKKIAAMPLRERALHEAISLIGVVEQGGNNTGPVVDKIIRSNGGDVGESWCGDFVAYCYRRAGSRATSRSWAAAWAGIWGWFSGVSRIKVSILKPGDIVEYTWQHTGIFEKWISPGVAQVVEGNTGTQGNTSDTTSDGVHRRIRNVSLIQGAFRVHR